jgi:hypothetical protein
MTAPVDEATVRQFIEIISAHARQVINGAGPPGVLQLCRLNPLDEKIVPSRFTLDDVENMVRTAIGDALAGHNAYIEARTVRSDLRGSQRGGLEDTAWVFGLVADCDADKNMGGNITVRPSLVIETSPGNFHYWYLFTRAIPAAEAKVIGDAIRTSSGADKDTGVVTQPYRIAGTPNFPTAEKQARGRITIEATRIAEQTGRLWDPDELLQAFSAAPAAAAAAGAPAVDDEATLPEELLKSVREGGVGKADDKSRSALHQQDLHQHQPHRSRPRRPPPRRTCFPLSAWSMASSRAPSRRPSARWSPPAWKSTPAPARSYFQSERPGWRLRGAKPSRRD